MSDEWLVLWGKNGFWQCFRACHIIFCAPNSRELRHPSVCTLITTSCIPRTLVFSHFVIIIIFTWMLSGRAPSLLQHSMQQWTSICTLIMCIFSYAFFIAISATATTVNVQFHNIVISLPSNSCFRSPPPLVQNVGWWAAWLQIQVLQVAHFWKKDKNDKNTQSLEFTLIYSKAELESECQSRLNIKIHDTWKIMACQINKSFVYWKER